MENNNTQVKGFAFQKNGDMFRMREEAMKSKYNNSDNNLNKKLIELGFLCYLAERLDNVVIEIFPVGTIENPKENNSFQYGYFEYGPKFEKAKSYEEVSFQYELLKNKYENIYSVVGNKNKGR